MSPNTWKNLQIDIEIKTKNQFPKDSLFFEFSNTSKKIKKNTWKNLKIDIEIKIKNQFPKDSLFFEFSNTLKQKKIFLTQNS